MGSVNEDGNDGSSLVAGLPENIEDEWPEANVYLLKLGTALEVPVEGDARVAGLGREALLRLVREPAFREKLKEIFALVGPGEPYPFGGDAETRAAWSDNHHSRIDVVIREATQFAAEHRHPHISPSNVVSIFFQYFDGLCKDETGNIPPAVTLGLQYGVPTLYVNPLADRYVRVMVPPGHILADVTHASHGDLVALVGSLTNIQERLGYKKLGGRRLEVDDEQMRFVHTLRTTQTGRGKGRTWHHVARIVSKRFAEDVSETTLKERYRTWRRANGIDREIAGS